jgi:hypothetical protein
MRLPRVRKGTIAVDVNVVQTEVVRVRLSMFKEGYPRLNTDLRENEVEDLITLLQYKLAQARGEIG